MAVPALRSGGRALAQKPARANKPARPKWMTRFLAELANTSNVSAAARKARVDTSTVYERRRKDAGFAREWQVALCEGYDNLEMDLLHRVRTGEIKVAAGAKRGARQFDNATAFRLLVAHRESATRQRAMREHEDTQTVRAAIDAKLDEMRERVMARRALAVHSEASVADGTPA